MSYRQLLETGIPVRPDHESCGDKLLREVELISRGFGGFAEAAKESVAPSNIVETAGKVAVGVALGAGLAWLSRGRSLSRTVAGIIGGAATVSFARDILLNGQLIGSALEDNWRDDRNWNRNVRIMEKSVGQFGFDTALMTASGFAGGACFAGLRGRLAVSSIEISPKLSEPIHAAAETRLARNTPEQAPYYRPAEGYHVLPTLRHGHTGVAIEMYGPETAAARVVENFGKGIVQVESVTPGRMQEIFHGSGFYVDRQGTIATAFHVVENAGGIGAKCRVFVEGKPYTATIRRIDAANDLALLRTEVPTPSHVEPARLAKGAPAENAGVLAFGYPSSSTMHVSEGAIEAARCVFKDRKSFGAWENPDALFHSVQIRTMNGSSGGPLFNAATGEVVGVITLGSGRVSYARPSDKLLSLMKKPDGTVLRHLLG